MHIIKRKSAASRWENASTWARTRVLSYVRTHAQTDGQPDNIVPPVPSIVWA